MVSTQSEKEKEGKEIKEKQFRVILPLKSHTRAT
jgi:hypothetical protein